jgi:hypothetical protein
MNTDTRMGATMRTRLSVLAVFFLFAAILPTRAQSLAGTWDTVLDVHGVIFPQLEELRIAGDGGVVTAIYGIRRLAECDDKLLTQTGPCAPGQTNVTGQLAIDESKGTIAVNGLKISDMAMRGIGTAADSRWARDLFWFGPGEPWTFQRAASTLVMSRRSYPIIPDMGLDGSKALVIEKSFYAVDASFAGDLVLFAAAIEDSVLKMACLMPVISGDAAPAREFRTLMRDVVAVSQKRQELVASMLASPNPSADMIERFVQVQSTLSAKDGAPSTKDIAATAVALGLTAQQIERFVREIALRPHADPADALVFSTLKPYETGIRACYKQHFG